MTDCSIEERMVELAQEAAEAAIAVGDSPFGAVVFDEEGRVICTASNSQRSDNDPTAHAEINALRAAGRLLGTSRLTGFRIATNAEPCPMCMAAIIKSGLVALVYGSAQEDTTNPRLRATEINLRAAYPIIIRSSVRLSVCDSQIRRGRALGRRIFKTTVHPAGTLPQSNSRQ